MSRSRVARAGLSTGVRGVHAEPDAGHAERIAAVLGVLQPEAFAMGRTAARVWGAPVPTVSDERIEIGVPRGHRAPRRGGVLGRSVDVRPREVTWWRGVRVTSPARTFLDLAGALSISDLVAVGDSIVRWDQEVTSIPAIEAVLREHPLARGIAEARRACGILSTRSESPQESRLRAALLLAGLPPMEVNAPIRDRGRLVARGDLLFPDYRVLVEYEGRQHADDIRQWRRDLTRIGELQALGYLVERAHADDVADPRALAARLRIHLARRGWAPAFRR